MVSQCACWEISSAKECTSITRDLKAHIRNTRFLNYAQMHRYDQIYRCLEILHVETYSCMQEYITKRYSVNIRNIQICDFITACWPDCPRFPLSRSHTCATRFQHLTVRMLLPWLRCCRGSRSLIHPIKALSVFNRHVQLLTELLERLVRRQIQPVEADGERQYKS